MPPDRGRASKACTSCRKQKTRCYASDTPGNTCLRCITLNLSCSLADGELITSTPVRNGTTSETDDRLNRLEQAVNTLLNRIGETPIVQSARSATPLSPSRPIRDSSQAQDPGNNQVTAPIYVLRDLAADAGAESPHEVRNRHEITYGTPSGDIINEGLLTLQEAANLLQIFQEHYGRWITLNALSPVDIVLATVRRSPLLLCACCLIAVRHTTQEAASNLAPKLFERAREQLSKALLMTPQRIEFFQACIILCMWSTTVGQVPLSIDSWLLSGFALQHCNGTNLFDPITSNNHSASHSKRNLDNWCLWNHLCLVHLHYCVGTRRRSTLDRRQVDRCREVLNSDHATNFESRMVAEINLYWIIYEQCSLTHVNLPKAQAALSQWKKDWNFVLEQPRSQFLEMGFHFAQLLAYERALNARSARVRDALLTEMVRLSASIIQLAMDTADERTRHLSDHIYHMCAFAAVTLCRLLHLYETQLAASQDAAELDALIMSLIAWFHSIGLPCHAANTLGDTVSAFHKKLRPLARPASPALMDTTNDWLGDDLPRFFPELLGTDFSDGTDFNLLPDWPPFYQGPLT